MPHDWLHFALGRVCTKCCVVQTDGEFVDSNTCARDGAHAATRTGEEPSAFPNASDTEPRDEKSASSSTQELQHRGR